MSGIGFGELIILLLIGLIVLGPERLPRVANQLGGWLGQARRMTRVLKRQLEDELDLEPQQDIVPPARTRHAKLGFQGPPAAPGIAATPAAKSTAEKDDSHSEAHAASPNKGASDGRPEPAAADDSDLPAAPDTDKRGGA